MTNPSENTESNNKGSEIILRPYQFCNLTEAVVRPKDLFKELAEKVEIATILGTFQSTLTHFPYLRKIWKQNTEEERLLGVSLTGILDNLELYKGSINLGKLRDVAIQTNKEYAKLLSINPSTAITCTKPSGTVSQLVDSASGIHTRHSEYYIRSVRADNKDPLTTFLKDAGVPWEADVMKPDQTSVFYFPIKSPKGALTRDSLTAVEHLEIWKKFQEDWCEHKPSITVTVKENEWPEVGAWVYNNFDLISGVSFLPHSDHTYRQAPYQECTKEEYEDLKSKMPKEIRWQDLSHYEMEDNTAGLQTLACSADGCEVVDLT